MGNKYAVVLSDVHIGNNAPTCWYQAAVHEAYLTRALRWIVEQREAVREVIFLGDLFDVWTYAPDVRPPAIHEIIAANPRLLHRRGPVAALVRALPGRVRFMPGNHDGTLTRADVDVLNRSLGVPAEFGIRFFGSPWHQITGQSGARTVFAHGHHWCMFNAPDPRTKENWSTLPSGHFVTRAISYRLAKTLAPGQTAADLPNSGIPRRPDWQQVMAALSRSDDLVAFMLTYFCWAMGMPVSKRIVMPDGSSSSCVEAMQVYAGLYMEWTKRMRPQDALRAIAADLYGDDLAWFAQRLALKTASDLAVMGHTHKPVGGLTVSPVNYVNSGYECVAKPDTGTKAFTLTCVDLENATAQLFAVAPDGVRPITAAPFYSVVRRGAMDFSCYVRIENRSDVPLRLVGRPEAIESDWVVSPPQVIKPNETVNIWVQDRLGRKGSGGRFSYIRGERRLDFEVRCPTGVSANVVTSPVARFSTKTGASEWRTGTVERFGHPLQARFVVEPIGVSPGAVPRVTDGPQYELEAPAEPPASHLQAARRILTRAPAWRGEVLCLARLRSKDGQPLLDPASEQTAAGEQLRNPPNHLSSPQIQSVDVDGQSLRFLWINPTGEFPGGAVFLPEPGASTLTVATWNVARMDADFRKSCGNEHHAEMQLVTFIERQPVPWQMRLGSLALHNRSRGRTSLGYSPCNACCHDLALFLAALKRLSAGTTGMISWQTLYEGRPMCGHPTDAANIIGLREAGWVVHGPGAGRMTAVPPIIRHRLPVATPR